MTQTVPATAVLGPGKTGLTIGLRVLNLDGTTYAAFSATGVAETSVLGTYRKAGGVVCPDAGGYIVWGVSGTDYAEATVESTAVNVTHVKDTALNESVAGRLAAALSTLLDVATPVLTAASVNQSGDAYARLGAPAGASVSADIAAIAAASALGSGAIVFVYTLTNSSGGAPIADADVWVTSDEAGSNVLASGQTDQNGVVTFYLDGGTVYVWRQKSGWDFVNPDAEVVS